MGLPSAASESWKALQREIAVWAVAPISLARAIIGGIARSTFAPPRIAGTTEDHQLITCQAGVDFFEARHRSLP
jgi:hypothetical protein